MHMPGNRILRRCGLIFGIAPLFGTAWTKAADSSERPEHSSIQPLILRLLRSTQPANAARSGYRTAENLPDQQRADMLAAATIARDDVEEIRGMRRGLKDFDKAERE